MPAFPPLPGRSSPNPERADRLGTFTDDPYLDGCTVLRRLSAPGEVLSRSCDERAAAVSPSGRRIATIHILSDGLGPREVSVRRDTGRQLGDYRVAGWFGRIDFAYRSASMVPRCTRPTRTTTVWFIVRGRTWSGEISSNPSTRV